MELGRMPARSDRTWSKLGLRLLLLLGISRISRRPRFYVKRHLDLEFARPGVAYMPAHDARRAHDLRQCARADVPGPCLQNLLRGRIFDLFSTLCEF